ncbi:MAG: TlpA disulfide reductase family protein [Rhodothermales bacterium]
MSGEHNTVWSLFLLGAVMVLLVVSGCAGDEDSREAVRSPVAVLEAAPDFERVTMEGDTLRLSELDASAIVLNFWATWCAPCRVEIPGFIAIQEEMDAERVRFVGVSFDEDGFEAVRPYAEEMGINYPLVIGDDALASDFGGVPGLPTTFLLDGGLHIRQRFVGVVDEETLRSVLEDML